MVFFRKYKKLYTCLKDCCKDMTNEGQTAPVYWRAKWGLSPLEECPMVGRGRLPGNGTGMFSGAGVRGLYTGLGLRVLTHERSEVQRPTFWSAILTRNIVIQHQSREDPLIECSKFSFLFYMKKNEKKFPYIFVLQIGPVKEPHNVIYTKCPDLHWGPCRY